MRIEFISIENEYAHVQPTVQGEIPASGPILVPTQLLFTRCYNILTDHHVTIILVNINGNMLKSRSYLLLRS